MLLEKVIQNRKIKSAEKFKELCPESYKWFNSEEFLDMFNYTRCVSLTISMKENFDSKREVNPCLPFTDSAGVVPLTRIEDYLLGQGFQVSTVAETNYHQEYVLVIKLP